LGAIKKIKINCLDYAESETKNLENPKR
jgi:hypothetical protein